MRKHMQSLSYNRKHVSRTLFILDCNKSNCHFHAPRTSGTASWLQQPWSPWGHWTSRSCWGVGTLQLSRCRQLWHPWKQKPILSANAASEVCQEIKYFFYKIRVASVMPCGIFVKALWATKTIVRKHHLQQFVIFRISIMTLRTKYMGHLWNGRGPSLKWAFTWKRERDGPTCSCASSQNGCTSECNAGSHVWWRWSSASSSWSPRLQVTLTPLKCQWNRRKIWFTSLQYITLRDNIPLLQKLNFKE